MSSVDVLVQSDPDLALSLIGDRNPVRSGDRSTYTLFYANSAGVTLSDVGVRLPVPEGTSVSYVSEGGEVVGSEVRWDLGELEVMASGQRTLVLSVDQPSDFVLSTAGASDGAETASARAGFATAVQDEIPLTVVLTATPNPVTPGGQIDYLATVSNEGTMDLTGVELRLVIPGESLSFDEDAIAGECDATSCDPGETVEFTLGLLPQLAGLPFSALFDHQSNRYLIEQIAIATVPSATLFLLAEERRNALAEHPATLIVGATQKRGRHPHFTHLPFAEIEANTIAGLRPGSRRLKQLEATTSSVLDLLPNYSAFHFADHGIFSSEDPDTAALVLDPDISGDGLIMLDDIFSEVLNGELAHLHLVTLSACGTLAGAGRDGPLGMGQAFFAAGVPRVVGTLWPVRDKASAELMIAFYRNLRSQPNVAQALRQGILEQLRKGKPYSDPASWAAYAVAGG